MTGQPATTSGWRQLGRELGRARRALLVLAAWSVIEALPALLSGRLVATALDHGFLAGHPLVGLGWLACFGLTVAIGALAAGAAYRWLGEIVEPLRDALVRTVVTGTLHRSAAGLDHPDATAIARLTRQVETVRDVIAGQLLILRQFAVTTVAVTIGVASLDPRLVAYIAIPLGTALLLFAALLRPLIARQRDQYLAEERIADTTADTLTGLRDVVACGAQHRMAATVGATIDRYTRTSKTLATLATLRRLTIAVGADLPLVLILLAAPGLLIDGLTAGTIIGAITYITANLEPALRAFVQAIGASGPRLVVAIHRISETSRIPTPPPRPRPAAAPHGHRIELDDLTFRYSPHAHPIAAGLTLTVPPGSHLAIVGPSGIGKSTLANLIAGLTAPTGGQIRLGGHPLTDLDPEHLHRRRVLIPQQAYVFLGTLRANLAYLRPDATNADLDHAVDRLGIGPLRDRLGGYDTLLDPTALSAGERQLIALARAYLAPAPVAILDEATCHLDPGAEARVEDAFRQRPGTLIVIAHRISSARRADQILLMNGAAPQLGTHHGLLRTSPLYADLTGAWHDHRSPEANLTAAEGA